MQDLSHLAAKSLATDSMHAGNQIWDRSSMSAPGGDSGDEQDFAAHGAPEIEEIQHDRTVLLGNGKKPPEPVIDNPYPKTTTPKWVRAGGVASEGLDNYPGDLHG